MGRRTGLDRDSLIRRLMATFLGELEELEELEEESA